MELVDLYRDVILDHNRKPRNFGPLDRADASVEGFKGLESPFVALVDVDRLETVRDAALVYVGMTRARAGLWIAVNENLRDVLGETIRRRGLDAVISTRSGYGH